MPTKCEESAARETISNLRYQHGFAMRVEGSADIETRYVEDWNENERNPERPLEFRSKRVAEATTWVECLEILRAKGLA